MQAGNPSPTVISFLIRPAAPWRRRRSAAGRHDGVALPPGGSPEYFAGSMDQGGPYGAPQDAISWWKFDADFVTPANSTFTLTNTIPIAPYDTIFPCTPSSRACIPQPATANKIDILSYRQRPLHRLAYRNFGSHESLVTNQSVEASSTCPASAGGRSVPNTAGDLQEEPTRRATASTAGWLVARTAPAMALGYSASDATPTRALVHERLSTDPPAPCRRRGLATPAPARNSSTAGATTAI
jgi:hypothetical protein